MPSRPVSALILLFWLASTGYVVHRDVWPRLYANAPPPLHLDLVDEATARVPVRWQIYRGGERLGSLTTELRYAENDDTFWFDNEYREMKVPFGKVAIYLPEAKTGIRVTRTGDLREQTLTAKLELQTDYGLGLQAVASAEADIRGVVTDGVLTGRCRFKSPIAGAIDRPLDPVPVPDGQVLNPMMPVGRLRGIRPGQRWVIRQVDPLSRALAVAVNELAAEQTPFGKLAESIGGNHTPEVVATVRSAPEPLARRDGTTVECWVIDYRSGVNEAEATTWVAVDAGRVLRQEARLLDETLRFERDN